MIHNFSSNAFPWYRTVGFVGTLAVTAGVLISRPFHEDLFVVCVDDGVHIRCTTVAEFQSFSVQDLVQVMVFGEIFVYEFKELLSKCSLQSGTIRWGKPGHITLA